MLRTDLKYCRGEIGGLGNWNGGPEKRKGKKNGREKGKKNGKGKERKREKEKGKQHKNYLKKKRKK